VLVAAQLLHFLTRFADQLFRLLSMTVLAILVPFKGGSTTGGLAARMGY
jgi:hypothetical protein